MLFLLYINDVPDNLISKTFLYADDTSIYMPINRENPIQNLALLQQDLNSLSQWSRQWHIIFKPSKSIDITFTKSGTSNYQDLFLDANPIPQKLSHKHLGFILDNNLNFNAHVIDLASKVQKKINPLKFLSKSLKSCYLETIYLSFIRPHFDYCDILYNSANKTNLDRLERIHYQAALHVSGCIHGSNTQKVLSCLNWQNLSSRRAERLKFYMFKTCKLSPPVYIPVYSTRTKTK